MEDDILLAYLDASWSRPLSLNIYIRGDPIVCNAPTKYSKEASIARGEKTGEKGRNKD
jgi:hypothetical protein